MFKVHEKGAQGGPGEQARGSNEEAVSSEVESERLKLASQVMNSIKNELRILILAYVLHRYAQNRGAVIFRLIYLY